MVRDNNGVLWFRTLLLCQVCGKPADRTSDGVLWLARDWRDDWPGWPNGIEETEPPVCLPCVRLSLRMCPALRAGAVAYLCR